MHWSQEDMHWGQEDGSQEVAAGLTVDVAFGHNGPYEKTVDEAVGRAPGTAAVGKALDAAAVGKARDMTRMLPEEGVQKDRHSTATFGGDSCAPDPPFAQPCTDHDAPRKKLVHAHHGSMVHNADVEMDCKNAHCKIEAKSVPSTSKTSSTPLSDQQAVRGG